MSKYDNNFLSTRGLNPWFSLPVIVLFSIGSMILFTEIAMIIIKNVYGLGRLEFYMLVQQQEINETTKWALFIFQALSAFGGFIVGPLLFVYLLDKQTISDVFSKGRLDGTGIFYIALLVISFMVVNAAVLKWNMGIDFPEFMDGFERWAQQKEEEAARLTENLTAMPSFLHLAVAMLVIGILPAIGEELFFRGLLQNKLYSGTGNIHLAIWLTGIIFSLIHIQFYGFFPRMLLGVLFGYLYFWSASLWAPVIAHFINNGFTIAVLYLYQRGLINFNPDDPAAVPISAFLIFLAISIGIIWYFRQYVGMKAIDQG